MSNFIKTLTIKDAERVAKRTGAEGVIVLVVPKFKEPLEVQGASYGCDRQRCGVMGGLLDEIVKALRNGVIEP